MNAAIFPLPVIQYALKHGRGRQFYELRHYKFKTLSAIYREFLPDERESRVFKAICSVYNRRDYVLLSNYAYITDDGKVVY
jgi:hypothetical protein